MDSALRPRRFATNEDWEAWKRAYQHEYWLRNKERLLLVKQCEVKPLRRSHAKKGRVT
jgi:hypothetical protein